MEAEKRLEELRRLSKDELIQKIREHKKRLGDELIILGHHYQRDEIIELSDLRGDSFKLAKLASEQKQAKYIVFCGVHFMAESAEILAQPEQAVFIPDIQAGCPLADFADISDVERAWKEINEICKEKIIPITYVNSSAQLKAFCGKYDGACATSVSYTHLTLPTILLV